MKKILILCNTVYQIIVAVNLKNTIYRDCQVDIIISNHMNNYKRIKINIENERLFNNVFLADSFNFARRIHDFAYKNTIMEFIMEFNMKKNIESIFIPNIAYDYFLIANLENFSINLYEYIKKYLNKNIKVFLYEDGFSSYILMDKFYNSLKQNNGIRQQIKNIMFNKKDITEDIVGIYVFNPTLMAWKPTFDIIQMEMIDTNSKKLISQINSIFEYKNMIDVYDKPIIFFEESYYTEGIDIPDLKIVEQLSNIIGKEKIMVKIHPRNRINRYKEKGFKTNHNVEIPWEVIMLNNDFSNKILMSIASGSIATPFMLFGIKTKSVALIDYENINFPEDSKEYNEFLKQRIFLKNKDVFYLPTNMHELISYVEGNIKDIKRELI